MNAEEMIRLCQEHTLFAWSATGQVKPLPVESAQGVHFTDPDGKRYLDFNSQLMSVHVGHGHPRVLEAMKEQMDKLTFAWPGSATEPRARLGERLAAIMPGDMDAFFFTLGGADANESAINVSRQYTGRHKILSRYRSYHGGTHACMQLSGDPRRLQHEPGMPGVVRVMDPQPYDYSFGESAEEITRNHLTYLEEVIQYEGPEHIAAFFMEPIIGTNGVVPPPAGWVEGVRELTERHGILLVCDEVMSGFGRTGRMFAFEHAGIVPDLVTMAKGLTSSYVPMGAVGMRRHLAEHFRENVYWGGLTYNSHALACATALAVLDVIADEDLVGNAARLGPVMREEMERLEEAHPSVRTTRNIGLFGLVELGTQDGARLVPFRGAHPVMKEFNAELLNRGLFTVVWGGTFFVNPPLVINEEQLREGFAIIDKALHVVDRAIGS